MATRQRRPRPRTPRDVAGSSPHNRGHHPTPARRCRERATVVARLDLQSRARRRYAHLGQPAAAHADDPDRDAIVKIVLIDDQI